MHSTVIVSQTPHSLSPYPLALSQYPLYRMDSSHTYSRSSHLPDISFVLRTVYKLKYRTL
ncbi:hypothetical protein BT96DRAFT_924257 [Gymnopus androsaceus JB14]|uniref:Uncharacterized protein n=1 Tax=Gymnopus androsaceus JB14 TaxID=1447944 RepID=A0A6A4H4D6_9AGAR|nr:hypothetical protein BT96DRAFT_924257 [Gymnopus androsaceus JB14]